jgi:hypothetical protein
MFCQAVFLIFLPPWLISPAFSKHSFLISAQDRPAKITLSQGKKGICIFSQVLMALPEGIRKEIEVGEEACQIS